MVEKVIKQILRAIGIIILAVGIGAIVAYASSMFVLMLRLMEYGNEIMTGVYIVFVFAFLALSYHNIGKKYEKRKEEQDSNKSRDYFRDGNFAFKAR